MSSWNSALLTIILSLTELCDSNQIEFDLFQLPRKMTRLIQLAYHHPAKKIIQSPQVKASFLYNIGDNALQAIKDTGAVFKFLGDASIAFMHMLRGHAVYRASDTRLVMQQTGAEALPIVSLLNFLGGAILGYIGGLQLEKFGAEVFIGDMVGVAMTREITAIITGIIMAGRTCAAAHDSLNADDALIGNLC